jgi:hypothetical protein
MADASLDAITHSKNVRSEARPGSNLSDASQHAISSSCARSSRLAEGVDRARTTALARIRAIRRARCRAGSSTWSDIAVTGCQLQMMLNVYGKREAVLHFDCQNLAVPDPRDGFEQFDRLVLQQEIMHRSFWTRTVLASHLQLLDDTGRRNENGLATAYMQPFNAAKIHILEKFDEAALRLRER